MTRQVVDDARYLRHHATRGERLLWSHLRQRRVLGYKFRRQAPIGACIVDFVCLSARLIVEVDGPIHGERQGQDARRDAWLRWEGFRVLRFDADYVVEEIEYTMDMIREALLQLPPHPVTSVLEATSPP